MNETRTAYISSPFSQDRLATLRAALRDAPDLLRLGVDSYCDGETLLLVVRYRATRAGRVEFHRWLESHAVSVCEPDWDDEVHQQLAVEIHRFRCDGADLLADAPVLDIADRLQAKLAGGLGCAPKRTILGTRPSASANPTETLANVLDRHLGGAPVAVLPQITDAWWGQRRDMPAVVAIPPSCPPYVHRVQHVVLGE